MMMETVHKEEDGYTVNVSFENVASGTRVRYNGKDYRSGSFKAKGSVTCYCVNSSENGIAYIYLDEDLIKSGQGEVSSYITIIGDLDITAEGNKMYVENK